LSLQVFFSKSLKSEREILEGKFWPSEMMKSGRGTCSVVELADWTAVQVATKMGGTLYKSYRENLVPFYVFTEPLNSCTLASQTHFPVLVGFHLVHSSLGTMLRFIELQL
jgi:hypothetical protein